MSGTFIQVPPDSTGQKLRMRSRVIGADTVLEQAVFQGALPTYYATADAVAFTNNKTHFSIMNAAGSGLLVAIRKIFVINLSVSTGAVVGISLRFNANRITGHSGGSTITPVKADTANANLPAQITVLTNSTPTGPTLLYPFITTTEEETATAAMSKNLFQAMVNLQPEGPEVQELRLREGEGMALSQVSNTIVGSFAWFVVFTTDVL